MGGAHGMYGGTYGGGPLRMEQGMTGGCSDFHGKYCRGAIDRTRLCIPNPIYAAQQEYTCIAPPQQEVDQVTYMQIQRRMMERFAQLNPCFQEGRTYRGPYWCALGRIHESGVYFCLHVQMGVLQSLRQCQHL